MAVSRQLASDSPSLPTAPPDARPLPFRANHLTTHRRRCQRLERPAVTERVSEHPERSVERRQIGAGSQHRAPARHGASSQPTSLVDPISECLPQQRAKAVTNPLTLARYPKFFGPVDQDDQLRSVAVRCKEDLDAIDAGVHPRLKDDTIRPMCSGDLRVEFLIEGTKPAVSLINERVVHAPIGRAVLPLADDALGTRCTRRHLASLARQEATPHGCVRDLAEWRSRRPWSTGSATYGEAHAMPFVLGRPLGHRSLPIGGGTADVRVTPCCRALTAR